MESFTENEIALPSVEADDAFCAKCNKSFGTLATTNFCAEVINCAVAVQTPVISWMPASI